MGSTQTVSVSGVNIATYIDGEQGRPSVSVSWVVGFQANTNSIPSRSIVRAMIARRRAGAIRALRIVDRLVIAKAQSSSLSRPVLRSARRSDLV